jgi:hypothetical protein
MVGDQIQIKQLRLKKKSRAALTASLKKFTNDFTGKGRNQPVIQKRRRSLSK